MSSLLIALVGAAAVGGVIYYVAKPAAAAAAKPTTPIKPLPLVISTISPGSAGSDAIGGWQLTTVANVPLSVQTQLQAQQPVTPPFTIPAGSTWLQIYPAGGGPAYGAVVVNGAVKQWYVLPVLQATVSA
jgi:hypothetical protein